ncbi:putative ATP-grasp superfamily ATP-dependent carboligase [Streptosporangium becharense]|uniref:Putative ATP-grasp superfamily ATP-dependent carboligase n=1 Tax=Streptosporangium becharense TaxID=1816182 RepID=A0A7W9IKA0_9ACTN|nr:PAC2 family protein [Streptosporangium becharense]MBB2913320.1 putative ATP-grasp superfamily ATP-dependent carboligase [Streptosporangium becharense]MBB5822303.1 putative ATP-grasp superfamily ATP-dependent carboligase [Streptosporangium becharense]
MFDPTDLYRLDGDVPELTDPVLLYHFDGFVDAGAAGRLAIAHLLDELEHRVVATFDVDRLLDYRSRRPIMTFDTDRWVEVESPRIDLRLAHDTTGTPFLLLSGPEPDREWELFTAAVGALVTRLGVGKLVTTHGIPMAVPHTRPLGVTGHATRPELVAGQTSAFGRVQVPGSVASLIEFRLGAQGHDALGYAVHVPHYLAQAEYPAAAVTALEAVTKGTGLVFPLDGLRDAAEKTDAEIAEQIAASQELSTAITGLEQQYDAFAAGAARESLIAETAEMPTGEELAAQFEAFLAERDERRGD